MNPRDLPLPKANFQQQHCSAPDKLLPLARLRRDFEPVIVDDFDVAEAMIRDYSLMLLHTCRHAIFDVTVAGGQYFEIERTGDYGIRSLLVFSADSANRTNPFTSGAKMLTKWDLKAYRDDDDLERLVTEYLPK